MVPWVTSYLIHETPDGRRTMPEIKTFATKVEGFKNQKQIVAKIAKTRNKYCIVEAEVTKMYEQLWTKIKKEFQVPKGHTLFLTKTPELMVSVTESGNPLLCAWFRYATHADPDNVRF